MKQGKMKEKEEAEAEAAKGWNPSGINHCRRVLFALFCLVHMHPDDLHGHHNRMGSSYDHSLGLHGDDSMDSHGGMGYGGYGNSQHDLGELGESGGLDHYRHRDELDDSEDMGRH